MAEEPLYTFDRSGMAKLVRDHRRLEQQVHNLQRLLESRRPAAPLVTGYLVKTPSGGLDALANDEAGRAQCEVYALRNGALKAIGAQHYVNNVGAKVPGDTLVPAGRDPWGEFWVEGVESQSRYPPVYFWEPVVIREGESSVPTLGVDEVDHYSHGGLRYLSYVGDLERAGVEYLWFSPVTNPAAEWNDAVFRLTLGGTWRVKVNWTVRPGAPARFYSNPASAPYTFASATQGGDPVDLFRPERITAVQLLYVRDNSAGTWQQISDAGLETSLWTPAYGTTYGGQGGYNSAIFNAPAGAEVKLWVLPAPSSSTLNSASFLVDGGSIEWQYLGEQPTSYDRELSVSATATALPLRAAHTTK